MEIIMKETYLTNEMIEGLAKVFVNEEKYTEHLKTLWALRHVVVEMIEKNGDTGNLFKIFDLTNQLINAIDDGSVSIRNGQVHVNKRYKFR